MEVVISLVIHLEVPRVLGLGDVRPVQVLSDKLLIGMPQLLGRVSHSWEIACIAR